MASNRTRVDFRAIYADAIRAQHVASHDETDITAAIASTMDAIATLHAAVDDCLHASNFSQALQGLRYSEALLAQGTPETTDSEEMLPGSWLHAILHETPAVEHDVGAEYAEHCRERLRALRKREVALLLEFEERRASAALAAANPEGAPAPPPRRMTAAVRRRLLGPAQAGSLRSSQLSLSAAPSAVRAESGILVDATTGEPMPMHVRRPQPPRGVPESARAGIDAAKARYNTRIHGPPSTAEAENTPSTWLPTVVTPPQPFTARSGSALAASTGSDLSRSPPPRAVGQPPPSPLGKVTLGTAMMHIPNRSPLPTLRPPNASPLDLALARAAEIDRAVLQAAHVVTDARDAVESAMSSKAASPMLVSAGAGHAARTGLGTPSWSQFKPEPRAHSAVSELAASSLSEMLSMRKATDTPGTDFTVTPRTPAVGVPNTSLAPLRQHEHLTADYVGRPPRAAIAQLPHGAFSTFRREQQLHDRGRPSREYDGPFQSSLGLLHASAAVEGGPHQLQPDGHDDYFSLGDVSAVGVTGAEAADEVAWAAASATQLEQLVSRDVAAMVEEERQRLLLTAKEQQGQPRRSQQQQQQPVASRPPPAKVPMKPQFGKKGRNKNALRPTDQSRRLVPFAIRAARPHKEVTLMEYILALPNAAEIIDHLKMPVGMALEQTVEAWMAACLIQRTWRSYTARCEFAERKASIDDYCKTKLPQLDALEVIVRILRGCVTRRKYAEHRSRVHHVMQQRVDLENEANRYENAEWSSTAAFSIRRGGAKKKMYSAIPQVFLIPFDDADDMERRERLRIVQQSFAARLIQVAWGRFVTKKLHEHALEIATMMRVISKKPVNEDSLSFATFDPTTATDDGMNAEVSPQLLSRSVSASGVGSRRQSTNFQPLKGVKLSELHAQRLEREAAERLRRMQAEALLQEKLMRAREELRRRAQATLLIQRVCRAYRRRLFLFAKKLSVGGGRFLISANPFVRSLTSHHMRKQVPYGAHTEITRIIAQRSPHLIPELAASMAAAKCRSAVVIQALVRYTHSRIHTLALRRYLAARLIQRRWRLSRGRFREARRATHPHFASSCTDRW
jgi:hypothetical protein